MDPAGILMLQSLHEIFDILGTPFECISFFSELFFGPGPMKDAIQVQKKTPVVIPVKFNIPSDEMYFFHAMVAAGIKSKTIKMIT